MFCLKAWYSCPTKFLGTARLLLPSKSLILLPFLHLTDHYWGENAECFRDTPLSFLWKQQTPVCYPPIVRHSNIHHLCRYAFLEEVIIRQPRQSYASDLRTQALYRYATPLIIRPETLYDCCRKIEGLLIFFWYTDFWKKYFNDFSSDNTKIKEYSVIYPSILRLFCQISVHSSAM